MKPLITGILLALTAPALAGPVTIVVETAERPNTPATLYRYSDLFTRRLQPLATAVADSSGTLHFTTGVQGTQKALVRINGLGAELWLREGHYHFRMEKPAPGTARPIAGTARVAPYFQELDALDVNALMSDLNERLDAFLAENLATDGDAGMSAVAKARAGSQPLERDTGQAKMALRVYPGWDLARTDSFAQKLRNFYAGVNDPWFIQNLEYGIAGLYQGPNITDRNLFNRFLLAKPVLYDVPEYVRFINSFFTDHLLRFPFRNQTQQFQEYLRASRTDSLKALLAEHDFLRDDRLNELVLINELYRNQANALFDRNGVLGVLSDIRDHSAYVQHRQIAANMLWDLTAMSRGTELPMVDLLSATATPVALDSMLQGPTCLVVTKVGNAYSDQELAALGPLAQEYGNSIRFVHVVLDQDTAELAKWRKPRRTHGIWLLPHDQQELLDMWRISTAPTVFLLEDKTLTAAPAPLPSQGLTAELHRISTERARKKRPNRRGAPPPKR